MFVRMEAESSGNSRVMGCREMGSETGPFGTGIVPRFVGLGWRLESDLAAEAGAALLDVKVVVVEAEVLSTRSDGSALASCAEDGSAELLHGDPSRGLGYV